MILQNVRDMMCGIKGLCVESKKGRADKKGQEYPLMREAIGQLDGEG